MAAACICRALHLTRSDDIAFTLVPSTPYEVNAHSLVSTGCRFELAVLTVASVMACVEFSGPAPAAAPSDAQGCEVFPAGYLPAITTAANRTRRPALSGRTPKLPAQNGELGQAMILADGAYETLI